jgi:predicted phage-related endonuclease
MIIEKSFDQGSEEWHAARIDSIGGTGISNIITNGKLERSKSREDYLLEKAGEIISRQAKPNFQSWEMKWGHMYEPEARDLFSFTQGIEVETCAMIFYDESRSWHISPDFFNLEKEIGGEIKCPQLKEFKATVDGTKLPTKHILQCQTGLALTGFKKWAFMSYFPGLKPFITWVDRDEVAIKIIKAEVSIFLKDLNKLVEEMKNGSY